MDRHLKTHIFAANNQTKLNNAVNACLINLNI